jgi:hypothetical protein
MGDAHAGWGVPTRVGRMSSGGYARGSEVWSETRPLFPSAIALSPFVVLRRFAFCVP